MARQIGEITANYDATFPTNDCYLALVGEDPIRGNLAYVFLLALNGWSRQKVSDGRVPLLTAAALALTMRLDARDLLAMLAQTGVALVEVLEDVVVIRRYGKWQQTRKELSAARKSNAQRQQRHREKQFENNGSVTRDGEVSNNLARALEEKRREEKSVTNVREDVEEVCRAMQTSVLQRTERQPSVTPTWRREARLLLDADQRALVQVVGVIDWLTQDAFWRRNILGVPKLREKYDQLLLAMRGGNGSRPQLAVAVPVLPGKYAHVNDGAPTMEVGAGV